MTGIWEQEEGEARGPDSKSPVEWQLKGLCVIGSGSQFLPRGAWQDTDASRPWRETLSLARVEVGAGRAI